MYLLLYLLFIIILLFNKKKDNLHILIIAFIGIIIYNHPYCPDYQNYENVYNYIIKGYKYLDTGVGWYYVCLFFSKLGISFRLFKTLISVISLLLINHTISSLLNKINQRYYWGCYLIFPVLIHCVQFRFLLALAIILFGLKKISSNNKIDIFYSLILLISAYLIHSSCAFILAVYLILNIKIFKKYIKLLVAVIFIVSLIIILNPLLNHIVIEFMSHFVNLVRIERYFTTENAVSSIYSIIFGLITIYINYKPLNDLIKDKRIENMDNKFKNLIIFANKLALLDLLIVPLLLFDSNFNRLLQISIMITNVALLLLKQHGTDNLHVLKIKLNIIDYMVITSIFYFLIFIPKNTVFFTMLK